MSEPTDQPTAPDEQPAAESAPDQAPVGQRRAPRADPPPARTRRIDLQRVAIGAGAALLVLAFGGVVFAATQLARPGVAAVDPQHVTRGRDVLPDRPQSVGRAPLLERLRDRLERGRGPGHDGLRIPGRGSLALRQIAISAISGADVTLTTEDGWTRTITVTDATTITRAGEAITLADLEVGDQVRFRQVRSDDGTFAVTAIAVILPHVAGEVTATDGDTITIERRDGTTATIHVGSATTYHVRGVTNATLSDITTGMLIAAVGTETADGSLAAVAVYASARR